MQVTIQYIFWFCLILLFYTYIGYGIVLSILVLFKKVFSGSNESFHTIKKSELPTVSFITAAYNEEDWIESKIENCILLNYPLEKLELVFVSDGSDDKTPALIENYPYPEGLNWKHFHQPERKGKIAAVERVMSYITSDISVFTDANTNVNSDAINNIVRHYEDPKVGGVACEKRVSMEMKDSANAAGEGFYWRYESFLKSLDSQLYSVVGAAGELFSIRTKLFEPVAADTIIEDFYMTLKIAMQGYKIKYESNAYAVETASASVEEELKRKIRIAAGGIQAINRLKPLLNIFKYGRLSFQYISHRVLRWTLCPIALVLLFFANVYLAFRVGEIYTLFMLLQVVFYLFAIIGYVMAKQKIKRKIFFIPYYFCVMNYAVFKGFERYSKGKQSVVWEKAKRVEV